MITQIFSQKKLFLITILLLAGVFIFSVSTCLAIIGAASIREAEKFEQPKQQFEKPATIEKPVLQYTSASMRDPFKPYIVKQAKKTSEYIPTQESRVPPPKLTVQGIIWGSDIPQAIINNSVVRAGDTIEEARILEINKEGVKVFFKNRQYLLSSPGSSGETKE
jgi:sRNA-binding protein